MQVVPSLAFGGAEQMVVGLCNHLDPERFEVGVCALRPELPLAQRLRPGLAGPVALNCRGARLGRAKNWLEAWKLRKLIRALEPDIVHAHLPTAVMLSRVAAWRLPVKLVCTWHNVSSAKPDRPFGWRLAGTRRPGPVRCAAVSQAVAEDWTARLGVDPSRVVVIPNGVELERFLHLTAPSGRRNGRPRLLCVGSFTQQKNHSRLLKAFAMLSGRCPDCRLRLVGKGRTLKTCKQLVTDLGIADRVEFLKPHADVENDYGQADVFVLASDWEGLPLVLVEAMASGLPVVATRVGGNAEVVRDGTDGYLVEPGDPEALVGKLEDLLSDDGRRARMGAAGRERAGAEFRMERCARRYEEFYRKALEPVE